MKIEYTRQSIADLRKIAGNSRAYGDEVAVAVDSKIRTIIARIAQHPKAAEAVAERLSGPVCASYRSFAIRSIRSSTAFSKIG